MSSASWCVQAKSKHSQQNKRVENDLQPAAGKESLGVISKAMPASNKGSINVLFGEAIQTHLGKNFRGGHY